MPAHPRRLPQHHPFVSVGQRVDESAQLEHVGRFVVRPHLRNNIVRSTAAVLIDLLQSRGRRLGNLGDNYPVHGWQFPTTSTSNSPQPRLWPPRYFDNGRVSSALQLGEVAVVAIRKIECNVAVKRACSPSPRGPLSLKPTTGPYRILASRPSIAFLFPYALHSTTLAFNIARASKSPQATPSLSTPLYETTMHSTAPLCTPLRKTSRLSTSTKSRKASPTFTLEAVASGALKIAASSASKVEFSSASKVESSSASKESSSASKDLRGKHNARRFLGSSLPEDDDHRIMRGKYKRREGKVTQVYRKKWVINRLLASTTAARLLASITALDYRR
ncbi:hypothetical protein GGG16DRAFT_106892 [Schizophyllum commune]